MANNDKKKEIVIYFAPVWDCPECEAVNLADADVASDEDISDEKFESIMRESLNLDPWEDIPQDAKKSDLVRFPDVFFCHNCGTSFHSGPVKPLDGIDIPDGLGEGDLDI